MIGLIFLIEDLSGPVQHFGAGKLAMKDYKYFINEFETFGEDDLVIDVDTRITTLLDYFGEVLRGDATARGRRRNDSSMAERLALGCGF